MKLASLVPPPGTNKYELAIVAAREARRLNEWSRQSGQTVPGKVTASALEHAIKGEVPHYYEDPNNPTTQSIL
jgi:DNA-directed RNA polymerase subunit K/omega